MPGLEDAIGKHYFGAEGPPTPEQEYAERTKAMAKGAGELVDDPFVPGQKVKPSMAGVRPLDRAAVAAERAMDAVKPAAKSEPRFVYVDGEWQSAEGADT